MQTAPSLPDVHEAFLDALCKRHTPVTIYLVNGVRITGKIDEFDQTSIVLRSEHAPQYDAPSESGTSRKRIIFNHVISTVLAQDDAEQAAEYSMTYRKNHRSTSP